MLRNLVSSCCSRALVTSPCCIRTYSISVSSSSLKALTFTKAHYLIPRRALQIKNIYLQLDYKAPYSDTDLAEVLLVINSKPLVEISKYISKPRAELIVASRPFDAIEQLLDLKGFSLKILENFVNKYLDEKNKVKVVKVSTISDAGLVQGITPKVNKTYLKANVSTIAALSFNLQSVSFAHLSLEKRVLSWSSIKAFDKISSRTDFQHHRIYSLAKEVVSQLPQADLYIWEEFPRVLPKDTYINAKISTMIFQSYLVALINEQLNTIQGAKTKESEEEKQVAVTKEKADTKQFQNFVHLIKPSVVDNLFNLKIGNERISAQDNLSRLINYNMQIEPKGPFSVDINEMDWNMFIQTNDKSTKEQMSIAILVATAFHRLLIDTLNK